MEVERLVDIVNIVIFNSKSNLR